MEFVSKLDISVIICTYNPEERMFSRVLKAVGALEIQKGTTIDCIVVDNNSDIPITDLACVKLFLEKCSWAKVIRESKQGLSFARLAGIKAATASTIVFFDDDNEPAPNYLKVAQYCLKNYPSVAIWGPGNVVVEFLDPVSDWFSCNCRKFFQERNQQSIEYGCVMASWTDFYPPGTGQVVKRIVLEKYHQEVEAGKLTSTDRNGNSLLSGGDVQIVWEAIKMGLAAGISPELKIVHLIPSKRSNLEYVKRLSFGASSSYLPALAESFPLEKENLLKNIPSNIRITYDILRIVLKNILQMRYNFILLDVACYIGGVIGTLQATQVKKRQWIYYLSNILSLE